MLAVICVSAVFGQNKKVSSKKTHNTHNKNYSNTVSNPKDGVIINGVTWATKNVGAIKPEDDGYYFTWEEAQSACPNGWRLPTKEDFERLNNAGSIWTTENDISGRKFGDYNNYIFLPAAGWRYSDGTYGGIDTHGYYWSSTMADIEYSISLGFISDLSHVVGYVKTLGHSVRCVMDY